MIAIRDGQRTVTRGRTRGGEGTVYGQRVEPAGHQGPRGIPVRRHVQVAVLCRCIAPSLTFFPKVLMFGLTQGGGSFGPQAHRHGVWRAQ